MDEHRGGNTQSGFAARAMSPMAPTSHQAVSHLSQPAANHSYTARRPRPPPASHRCLPRSPLPRLRALLSLLVLLATWTSLFAAATAHETNGIGRRSALLHAAPAHDSDLIPAWKGPSLLVLDTRPPPDPPLMHLQRRQAKDASSTSSAAASKTSLATDPNATKTPFTVPQPFDTALSNNFTASCATFFRRLLTEPSFKQCHPFSLMLQVRLLSSHLSVLAAFV